MKRLNILIPGPLKFDFVKKGIKEYEKRISGFAECVIKAPKVKKKKDILKEEEKVLKAHMETRFYSIVLDHRGKSFSSSEEFAKYFENVLRNYPGINFIIGGSEGLSENLKKEANSIVSLSPLVFNHELALLVLLEVIYRSFCIINKHPYHR
ncbi:MAG: 23S rRNA (pseudouridine(1915)-N(3))-methyltransferase RlmH [Thermodesulfobacteria bacterium]|nr:23S rRNA (pseudouridine(1915)-N(3))-methyltransferase RlmH [Thermodesulfobacteriota bacterium]